MRPLRLAAVLAPLPFLFATPAFATSHEVPASVSVQAWIHPEAEGLRLIVRTPLEAMRDIEWPIDGPGFLELEGIEPLLREAARLWIVGYVTLFENGQVLDGLEVVRVRLSRPSDRSFSSWHDARAHLAAPPHDAGTELVWNQAHFDVELQVPIGDPGSRFSIDPKWAHLGVETTSVLHFLTPEGAERPFTYQGDPGVVHLDPRWHQAVWRFVKLGFAHILEGIDHLLFLLCLVIPFRRVLPLVPIVTAFTVAHSITLAAAVLGVAPAALWFPPLIEALIALSIVWMAVENMLQVHLGRRWLVAFAFGLVHGFGFSFLLRETLQFSGSHLWTALVAFNLGVELGQLAVLVVLVPALTWAFSRVPERAAVIVASAFVAHTGWHWMTDRAAAFMAYPLAWPVLDRAAVAAGMRWAMLALVCVGAAWALSHLARRYPMGPYRRTVVGPTSAP